MISGHVPLLYTDWFEPLNYYYHESQVWSLVFKWNVSCASLSSPDAQRLCRVFFVRFTSPHAIIWTRSDCGRVLWQAEVQLFVQTDKSTSWPVTIQEWTLLSGSWIRVGAPWSFFTTSFLNSSMNSRKIKCVVCAHCIHKKPRSGLSQCFSSPPTPPSLFYGSHLCLFYFLLHSRFLQRDAFAIRHVLRCNRT